MYANRVDGNQQIIVKALRSAGAVVVPMTGDQRIGFDLLVAYRKRLFVVEIKDPSQPPSKRRLTDGEAARKSQLEAAGVNYHLVETADQVLEIIGANYVCAQTNQESEP